MGCKVKAVVGTQSCLRNVPRPLTLQRGYFRNVWVEERPGLEEMVAGGVDVSCVCVWRGV